MRRPVQIVTCLAAVAFTATVLSAGSAVAASTGTPAAATIAAHGLGARRPDIRIAPRAVVLDTSPASVDLREWAVTPGNQGQLGSCVTWAIDYSMLGWYARYSGRAGEPFAPMYTYTQINGGVDNGAYPSAALQVALTQGNDTRADYSQGDYDWSHKPTAAEHANAAHFKIKGYATLFVGSGQLGTAALLKHALATKHPVAIEMAVRQGFDYLGSSSSAVDNDVSSTIRGYHEVMAVGYDAAGLIVENSWGTGWANGGFGRISWSVVQHDIWEGDTIDGFATPPTPPTVSTPAIAVQSAGTATSTTMTFKVSWKGTLGTSGAITRYDAWYQVDGGALVPVKLATVTATSVTVTVKVGHPYRIAVRPSAGIIPGALHYTAVFTPTHAH